MTATMLLPWAFGIICSKTGFTCSRFCASPGVTPSAIAVNASFTKTLRITVLIHLPSLFEVSPLRDNIGWHCCIWGVDLPLRNPRASGTLNIFLGRFGQRARTSYFYTVRSTSLFGIREGRCRNRIVGMAAMEHLSHEECGRTLMVPLTISPDRVPKIHNQPSIEEGSPHRAQLRP